VETAFDVNSKTIEVLGRIGGVFSDTIKAWKSFNSNNSHICFFRTTEDAAISSHSKRSLRAIKAIFQEMEKDHNKIMSLKRKCSEFSSTVSHKLYLFPSSLFATGADSLTFQMKLKLRLILENKAVADQNGKISEFTVSVSSCGYTLGITLADAGLLQVLYPPALAAAIFSMQKSAVPFELTPRAFAFALAALFVLVYAIRFVGRRLLPHFRVLKEISAVWFKNRNLNGKTHTTDIELGEIVADISTDRNAIGEEPNDP
jgi:hypothetical protein